MNLRPRQKERLQKRIESAKKGLELQRRRESKGLKAYWVAKQMGIAPTMLSMLEGGERFWTDRLEAAFKKAIGE